MNIKTQFIALFRLLGIALILLALNQTGFSQSIWTNPITGSTPYLENPYITGQTFNANITVSGVSRSAGINGNAGADRFNANNWGVGGTFDNTNYFQFTLTPNAGFNIDFTSLVYTSTASGTGPTTFAIRSSLDGYTANIGTPAPSGATINLSAAAYQNITTAITFRLYGWGAGGTAGTYSVNDFTFNGSVAANPVTCTAPGGLAATNITDLTADVSWNTVGGAVGYEYVVNTNPADPAGAGTATTNLTEAVTGLTASTTYYLHVRTNCGSGNFSSWSTVSFTTDVTPCIAPINLAASNITDITTDASWDAQTGATGYEYVVDMSSSDPAGSGTFTTNLTESVAGLTAVTVYYLHVRTDCGSGNLSPWSTITFTTDVTPCIAPINLAASNITDITADVSWDAQTGATGYEYVVDMSSSDPAGSGTFTTNLTESVAGLTAVTVYYLHVRTDCGSGNLSPWSTISFTTDVTPCIAPINLAASNITDITADVSWDAQTGVGYEYVVDMNSSDPTGSGTFTTNLTESVTGLTAVTVYYLHVRTDCGSGNLSPWSTISFTTDVTPCIAPSNLSVTNITDAAADVSWDAETGVGYEYVVDMNSSDPAGSGTFTTNLTGAVTGLTAVTVYYLHVRTDCGSGNLSPWSTISFTTDVTPCIAPSNLSVANITDVTADVLWDAETGVGYEYVVDQISTDPTGAGISTTNVTESISTLTASTIYYLHVRTDCGSGNLSPWSTISFTTDVTPCIAPDNLSVTNITDATADVSWDAETGVGYEYVVDMNSSDPAGSGTFTTNLTEAVTGLTAVTVYYLHVRTDCGGGNLSPWSTISFTTDVTPCIAPSNLSVANITDATADVSWDAETGVGYEYVVDQISTDPTGAGISTTNVTESISGLTASTIYYLHVRTNCGSGNLSPWSTISFTTDATPCNEPANVLVSGVSAIAATISWDVETGATGYEYVVDLSSADPSGAGTATTDLSETVSDLDPSTNYFVHIRSYCGGSLFSDWTTISFSTGSDLNVAENNVIDLSIYPNPVTDALTIQLYNTTEKTSVTIFNSLGQVLYTNVITQQGIVDVSALENGLYYIRFEQENNVLVKQFVKE